MDGLSRQDWVKEDCGESQPEPVRSQGVGVGVAVEHTFYTLMSVTILPLVHHSKH